MGGGYTSIVKKLLFDVEVLLNEDFLKKREYYEKIAEKIIFTGMIDEYYNYCFGELEYRSLKFEEEVLNIDNFQGVAVMNFTDIETPYTRIIEHKHFEFGNQNKTIITREYPKEWKKGDEPYYPINNEKNNNIYEKYKKLSKKDANVIFGGRLGTYKYYDMDKVIEEALKIVEKEK